DAILGEIKGATVFINYLAATAQDVASTRGHKTVTAADVMKALEMIDHADIAADLEDDLDIFRETGRKVKSKPEGGPTRRKPKETSAYKGKVKVPGGSAAGPSVTVTGATPRARPTKPLMVDSSTSSGDEEDYLQPEGEGGHNAGAGGEEDWQTDETSEFEIIDEDDDGVEDDEDAVMD
ncbi:hypothetical protein FRB90_007371, partial [Tulasnella sp. 427]